MARRPPYPRCRARSVDGLRTCDQEMRFVREAPAPGLGRPGQTVFLFVCPRCASGRAVTVK
jgi:hypothetical protein